MKATCRRLERSGLDRAARCDFAPHGAPGWCRRGSAWSTPTSIGCCTEEGEWLARVSGRLRHDAAARPDFPAVGDWVAVDPPREDGDARIRAVLPRASRFSRRAAGDRTEEQVVAANIDIVFLVAGLDGDFNPRRIERYLLVASGQRRHAGGRPQQGRSGRRTRPVTSSEVRASRRAPHVHAVSCNEPPSLARCAPTSAPAAPARCSARPASASPRSSTAWSATTCWRPATCVISDSRGRHTSTSRQLVLLPDGGILIDTPGMRELQLWETGEAAASTFADMAALADGCRFRDCAPRSPSRAAR